MSEKELLVAMLLLDIAIRFIDLSMKITESVLKYSYYLIWWVVIATHTIFITQVTPIKPKGGARCLKKICY